MAADEASDSDAESVVLEEEEEELFTLQAGFDLDWLQKVDLGPPSKDTPTPELDVNISRYYDILQYILYETNNPATVDRTSKPRRKLANLTTTIVCLGSPQKCAALLLEGGRQCPGNIHLVLSTSWLLKTVDESQPGVRNLFLCKAITFEDGGSSYLDTFDPPRRVTYFMNFFTSLCTSGERKDGNELEQGLDCPMSSSVILSTKILDKIYTRILMAEAGILFPETLAFAYKPEQPYEVPEDAAIRVVNLEGSAEMESQVLEEVTKFLKKHSLRFPQVVVKPSGPSFHGQSRVLIHDIKEVIVIWSSVLELLKEAEEGDGVLLEIFYAPLQFARSKHDQPLSFRVRSTGCRGRNDTAQCTSLICNIGPSQEPILTIDTIPQSMDTTLLQFGLETERRRLHDRTRSDCEVLLARLIQEEKRLSAKQRGGEGAETDLITIDFVLGHDRGALVPIAIEVNDYDSMENAQLYEFINPNLKGKTLRPVVETMVERSQQYLVHGKHMIILGACDPSRKFIWNAAKQYGVKTCLVDRAECYPYAVQQADLFIQYDFTEHTKDDQHAEKICDLVKNSGWKIDGCCTFWDDNGPLAARICDLLKLTSQGLQGALNAKKKSKTQEILRAKTGDIPHFPRSYLYTSDSVHVTEKDRLSSAIDKLDLPCIMKMEYSTDAVGVKLVHDKAEAVQHYDMIMSSLTSDYISYGLGLGHGKEMMIMEYIKGTEHDIEVIIFKRKLIAAFVSDNGPTRSGCFTETAACMPSCLPEDKVGQLITAAYQCCTEIGLVNGVFNVEMKMTQTGPKLIEINATMTGSYLRDWIQRCYDVDLVLCVFMVFCGIRPVIPVCKPKGQLMGVMCVPSLHKTVLQSSAFKTLVNTLLTQRLIRYVTFVEEEVTAHDEKEKMLEVPGLEVPLAHISVMANDVDKSKASLLQVCQALRISSTQYEVASFVADFTDHIPLPLLVG